MIVKYQFHAAMLDTGIDEYITVGSKSMVLIKLDYAYLCVQENLFMPRVFCLFNHAS